MILTLRGRIPSKKNSKQIIQCGGRHMIISSSEYNKWEKWAVLELKSQSNKLGQTHPIELCEVTMDFIMPDKRRCDLSNRCEGVADAMVKSGIIVDDCWQVMKKLTLAYNRTSKDECGVIITILVS